jgi:pimeloyl-ACP methyl ester carboxylesterase
MRYLDWGGDGPPIIALHGLASSAHWYDIVAPLLCNQFRIIAPDQRGHGQTTQAGMGYDWETLCRDVTGLADHLGLDRAAVVGHSWGGNVATNLAAIHPERVGRLVMIEGGFLGGATARDPDWETRKARIRPRDVSGTRVEFLNRLRAELADCWSGELERILQTMVYEDEEGQMQDVLRPDNHIQAMKAMFDQSPSELLPRITCPTMVVAAGPKPEMAGSDSAIRRSEMVAVAAESLKNGLVHWVPETIHDIGYDKPEELAGLIREFLAEG